MRPRWRVVFELNDGTLMEKYTVVVLPGWIASSGAKIEYEVAHACGIEVVALADLVDIEAL